MKKVILTITIASLVCASSWAQEVTEKSSKPENPVRIGVKFGFPNIVGLHLEYATPLLGGRIAPTVDFSIIPINVNEDSDFAYGNGDFEFRYSYLEVGANIYFFKPGRGLYANVSYGRTSLRYDFLDYYDEVEDIGGGVGKLDIAFNALNLKLGAKLGNSFYFRPEIGVAIVGVQENISYTIVYPDGTTEIETLDEDLPEFFIGLMPMFNLGFGVAF
ncbi:MAG: hypothetical protein AAF944_03165 [Bacteroidota bacterium]